MNESPSHDPTAAFDPNDGSAVEPFFTNPNDALRDKGADLTESDNAPETQHSSPQISAEINVADVPGLKIMDEVARGGMGAVLRAHDMTLRRDVALKVLLERSSRSTEIVRRFEEEAQIGGQLQHPGIVPVYAFGRFADQRPYFTMKLVKGQTLAKLFSNRADPTIDRPKLLKIFEQLCQAIAYAHSKHVIHRDLKPANVMVGSFGEVQVMDWGLAKVLDPKAKASTSDFPLQGSTVIRTVRSSPTGTVALECDDTQFGTVLGTPNFMAPEQAVGNMEILDERADVFSLGAILCLLLTGRPPYVGTDAITTYQLALQADLVDAYAALDNCKVDDELVALTKKCLAPKAKDRPRDAGELAAEFTKYLESVEGRLRAEQLARIEAQTNEINERKRRKTQLVLSSVAGVILLIGIAGTLWNNNEARKAQHEAEVAEALAADERNKAIEAENGAVVAVNFLSDIFGAPCPEGLQEGLGIRVSMLDALKAAEKKIPTAFQGKERFEAKVRHAIGMTWRNLGQFAEAKENLERAVALREKYLGPNADETLESQNALAAVLLKSPNTVTQAIELLEPMRDRFGQMNNSKLSIASLNNLALAYMSAGRTKDAIAAFEHLRDLQADALAEGDPDAQVALSNLGSTYLKDNQITKGIELLETASEGLSKSQGSEHARTLSAKNSLAKAYRMAKRHHEAIALLESVAPARRSLLGNDHRDTLITLHNLAIIYNELDQNNRAFPLFEEVRKRRVAKDPTARETLGTLLDLSNRYQKAGKLAAAANVLEELGHIQLKNGKAPDAAKTTAKCLELRQQQKLDDWETARIQILLGEALLADQEPAKAEISLAAGYANLKRHIGKAPTPERSTTLMHALDLMIRCAEANKHPQRASQLQVEKAAHQTMP